jgi:hypothetical protein
MIRIVLILVLVLLVSEARAACVLPGSVSGTREFSLPRNTVCLIRRANRFSTHLAYRVTVRPKLGRFGKASLEEMAYQAGNKVGDDYFEYISTEIRLGTKGDFIIKNIVHITP